MASRPKRWADATAKLQAGLEELTELREEYEEWRDGLPESLQECATAEKLDEVVDASFFDDVELAISEAEAIELPLGFGRD